MSNHQRRYAVLNIHDSKWIKKIRPAGSFRYACDQFGYTRNSYFAKLFTAREVKLIVDGVNTLKIIDLVDYV